MFNLILSEIPGRAQRKLTLGPQTAESQKEAKLLGWLEISQAIAEIRDIKLSTPKPPEVGD